MVTGKSPIVPMTWVAQKQPLSDASEEVPMVTQLDEEKKRLWELAKANLEKVHKRYKDFVDKVLTRGEVSRRRRGVVEHQELLVARRFKS
jgi:hypothetical protein